MIKNDLKILIAYFSPTGNGKRIAKQIAQCLKSDFTLSDISLKNITLSQNRRGFEMPDYNLLFFIIPVYCQRCPAVIKRFLKNVKFEGAAVPCVTYGSVKAGRALKELGGLLKKCGAKILCGAEFACKHSYIQELVKKNNGISGNNKVCGNDAINSALGISDTEKKAVKTLCSTALQKLNDNAFNTSKFPSRFNPLSLIAPKFRTRAGVKFLYKSDCATCKKCKPLCPFDAIKDNGAIIKRHCNRCGACVKYCLSGTRKFALRFAMRKYLEKYYNPLLTFKIY